MDRGAVISNMETNDKVAAFSTLFYPKVSILDPELHILFQRIKTAAGVADIMSHAFEKYFTRVKTAYIQDRVGEAMLKTCIHYGRLHIMNLKIMRQELILCGPHALQLTALRGEAMK
jgi:alcohol dehydrogenase YqhD (iron-dependent ADH family)